MVRYREPAAPPTVAVDARSGGTPHDATARPEVEDGADNEEVPEAVARDPELATGAVAAEPDWGAAPMAQPATRTADAAAPIKRGMTRFMPCRRAPVPAGWRYREASLGRAQEAYVHDSGSLRWRPCVCAPPTSCATPGPP